MSYSLGENPFPTDPVLVPDWFLRLLGHSECPPRCFPPVLPVPSLNAPSALPQCFPSVSPAFPRCPPPVPSPAPSFPASSLRLLPRQPSPAPWCCKLPRAPSGGKPAHRLYPPNIAKPSLITRSAASTGCFAITSWIPSSLLYAPPKAIYYPQETAPPDRWTTPATSDIVIHCVQSS